MPAENDAQFERFLTEVNAYAKRAYGVTYDEIEPDLPDATTEIARAMHAEGHSAIDFMHAVGIASGFVPNDRAVNRGLAALRGYAHDQGMAMDRKGAAYKAMPDGGVMKVSFITEVDDGASFLVETAPDASVMVFHDDMAFCSHAPDFMPVARGDDPASAVAAVDVPVEPMVSYGL